MEGFKKLKEDLDRIIQNDFHVLDDDESPSKSDSATTPPPATTPTSPAPTEVPPEVPPPMGDRIVAFFQRENLEKVVETNLFQICVILLVILDCVFVVLEILIDLKVLNSHLDSTSGWADFFHITSFTILNIFILEIFLKIYIYRLDFLRQKLEMFDALVIVVAWCLDVAYMHVDNVQGFELIVVLRLWRVARVLNGIIMGLRTRAAGRLKQEKELRSSLETQVQELKSANSKLETELQHLRTVARKYGVPEGALSSEGGVGGVGSVGGGAGRETPPKKGDVVLQISHMQMTQESEYL